VDILGPQTIFDSLEDYDEYIDGDSSYVRQVENYISTNTDNELDLQIEQMIEKREGMWNCKVCGKTASKKQIMHRHVETHFEGVEHNCHICGKSASSRRNLQQHIYDIHSELFSCDICGKSGMNRKSYRDHKYKFHKLLSVKQGHSFNKYITSKPKPLLRKQ
jgi:hypothetical protein